jgi:hypothetical protein
MINSNSSNNNKNSNNNRNTSNNAYNDKEGNIVDEHPLTIIKKKDPSFQLSFLSLSSSSKYQSKLSSTLPPIIKIAVWKDTRLEQLNILRDLIELLHINGFTIERILEYDPLKIAQILGIDDYVAELIFIEATKFIINNNN